jgi:hypothetical protein
MLQGGLPEYATTLGPANDERLILAAQREWLADEQTDGDTLYLASDCWVRLDHML